MFIPTYIFILFLLAKEIFKTFCQIKPILAILFMNLLEFLIRIPNRWFPITIKNSDGVSKWKGI